MKKKSLLWMMTAILTICGSTFLTACAVNDSPTGETTVTTDDNPLGQSLEGRWYAFYNATGTVTAKSPETGDDVTIDYSHVVDVYFFFQSGTGNFRRFFFNNDEVKPIGMLGISTDTRLTTFLYASSMEKPAVEGESMGNGQVNITERQDYKQQRPPESWTVSYDDDNITAAGVDGQQIVLLPASDELSEVINAWSYADNSAGAGAAGAGAGIISLEGIATLDWHGLLYLLEPNMQAAIIGVYDYNITDISVDSYHNMSFISTAQVYHINRIAPGAFRGLKHLRSINIADSGVQEIGDEAFKGCKSLVTATIPASCTVLGKEAYMDCTNLKTANMPGVNEMGESCFEGCSSMTTASLGREGLVTIPKRAFYGCSGLMSVEIPDCVTKIENEAFRSCSGFNPLNIPKKVASIGDYAFESCTSLITLTCLDANVKFGKYAFANCTKLLTVTPHDFYSSIDETVFSGCYSLEEKPVGK